MSFERPANANSRADQTTVRRANLGVVLQKIATGEPRSRARVAAGDRSHTRHGLQPRRRADRARPAPRDGGGRALRPGRPAGSDARARRPDRRGRARGERRLPRRLCRGSDGHDPARAARAHGQPPLEARPGPGSAGRGWHARRSTRSRRTGLVPVGVAVAMPGLVEASTGTLLRARTSTGPRSLSPPRSATGCRGSRARRQRGESRRARGALAGRRAGSVGLHLRLRRGGSRRRDLRRRRALPWRAGFRRRVRSSRPSTPTAHSASAARPAASRRSSARRRSPAAPASPSARTAARAA